MARTNDLARSGSTEWASHDKIILLHRFQRAYYVSCLVSEGGLMDPLTKPILFLSREHESWICSKMGNWCRSILLERAWGRGDLNDEESINVMNPYWDLHCWCLNVWNRLGVMNPYWDLCCWCLNAWNRFLVMFALHLSWWRCAWVWTKG